MIKHTKSVAERFWSHVNKKGRLVEGMETNCWEWDKEAKKDGRISFNAGGKNIISIHLFSYKISFGEIEKGKLVLKKCRNPICVRPDHFFLGTYRDVQGKRFIDKDGIEKKICVTCKKIFPYTEEFFYPARTKKSTVRFISSCKSCAREKVLKNKEIYWARLLWSGAKGDSVPRGLEFDLLPDDVLDLYEKQNGRCYWFGVKMIPSYKHKYPLKPSIDRLNRTIGYTKDNVVLCCLAANMGRNSASEEDFKEFILALQSNIDTSFWSI